MRFRDLFEKWGLTSLRVKTAFIDASFNPTPTDQEAAWELYVELLTRVATQELPEGMGTEESALSSMYSLFKTTRSILKEKGRKSVNFTKIAVVMLNQGIRPFTSKWHLRLVNNYLETDEGKKEFRAEFIEIQDLLHKYTKMLADIAEVEDLTDIEEID